LIINNKILLLKLADLFYNKKAELATANSTDIGTNLSVNSDNIERGIAAMREWASGSASVDGKTKGGLAIYSCYSDPSFVLLGLCLPPAILANGNNTAIHIYIPTVLRSYRSIFKQIVDESGLFPNITFVGSHRDFFEQSVTSPNIQSIVVFGDDWINNYLGSIRDHEKTLIYFGPGNNTAVILDKSNLTQAIHSITRLTTILSGQAAVCFKRCIVSSNVDFNDVLQLLSTQFKGVTTGTDVRTSVVTPIGFESIISTVAERVNEAAGNGAELIHFKIKTLEDGVMVTPAIIANPHPNSDLWQKYHFAPVLSIVQCKPEEISSFIRHNDYQLAVSVFGTDMKDEIIADLQADHAFVFDNCDFLDILRTNIGYRGHWGGFKNSAFTYSKESGYVKNGGKFDLYSLITQENK